MRLYWRKRTELPFESIKKKITEKINFKLEILDDKLKNEMSHLVVVISAEIDGDKCQPDDTSAVHGESNIFGLVEILWYFARFERVERAQDDVEHIIK